MSQVKPLRIAVGRDRGGWHERFAQALEAKKAAGCPIDYEIVNIENHDWIEQIASFDSLIWNPGYMGVRSASFFKEKIYFVERHLKKQATPNFETIWHFESKVAQSYLFELCGIPLPATKVSFDYQNASREAKRLELPLVFKESYGASSSNVRLVRDAKLLDQILQRQFCQANWDSAKAKYSSTIQRLAMSMFTPWFWAKIWQRVAGDERVGYTYFQEFVSGNEADLRITAIGNRFAYGFWRKNRPHDFRASGSGRIDFNTPIPEEPIRYCLRLNSQLGFDSMAYDVLFREDGFVITEMSYSYLDRVPYQSGRYYVLEGENLVRKEQGVWPQTLWVEWALLKAGIDSGG